MKLETVEFGNVKIPLFPTRFRFRPLTGANAMPRNPYTGEDDDEDGYGYWTKQPGSDAEVIPIRPSIMPLDFMRLPIPQWPYILAKVLLANETQMSKSIGYLVYIVKALADNTEAERVLTDYIPPPINNIWDMDIEKFYEWTRLTRNIMPI